MTGTKLVHVPYKGAGPLMIDLLAGQVDLAFDGMGTSAQQIKAGKLIPLAITSTKRNPVLPNVPTVEEAGVPGYEVRTWYAIWAVRGTPQAIGGIVGFFLARAERDQILADLALTRRFVARRR